MILKQSNASITICSYENKGRDDGEYNRYGKNPKSKKGYNPQAKKWHKELVEILDAVCTKCGVRKLMSWGMEFEYNLIDAAIEDYF